MGWQPPARPDWVRAINAGEIAPIAEEAALPLERDGLVREAAARQGCAARTTDEIDRQFGHVEYPAEDALDRLDHILRALADEARLNPIGRLLTRRFLLRLLEVRLQLMSYLRADPGVVEESIERPLFVAGAPRTGTTILHTLLAADPQHRVPLGWELLRPVPPPAPDDACSAGSGTPTVSEDPRIALADRELVRPQTVVSGLLSIHEYGGRNPKECLSAMSFAFQSEEFTARYEVPSYASWLEASDMRPAYEMHRLVLRVLQRRTPGTRWVLKSPVHLHALPTLFEVYPDARVALTHRDPLTLLASLTSLIANLRWAHSDHVDVEAIAAAHLRRYQASFEQLVAWCDAGQIPETQLHHSLFADFQSRPIDTVRHLYDRFGIELSAAAERGMRSALAANPAERHGSHRYDRDALGADPGFLRKRFEPYQRRFGIPSDRRGTGES